MSDISKADLKKEIQEILKDADLDNTSAKKVRLELQEKLDCDLTERKKEVDNLVMEVIDEQTQGSDEGSEEEGSDNDVEESEEENSEEEKPKPKKKAAAKPAPKKKAAKAKAAESDDEGSNFSDDAEEDAADSDGGGSDYEPDEPVKINKKRPAAKGKAAKRRGGSDDDSSGEEWGSAKKKKGGAKKKKAAGSDSDSDDEKPKKKRKKAANGKPNAYTAPVKLSEDLADIVGGDEMPRHEVVKRMWTYIKENNLQDPKNRQFIKCDEKLSKIVPTKKFRGFGMAKYLKDHMNVDKEKKETKVAVNSEDEDSD